MASYFSSIPHFCYLRNGLSSWAAIFLILDQDFHFFPSLRILFSQHSRAMNIRWLLYSNSVDSARLLAIRSKKSMVRNVCKTYAKAWWYGSDHAFFTFILNVSFSISFPSKTLLKHFMTFSTLVFVIFL